MVLYVLVAVAFVGIGVLVFSQDLPYWRHVRELRRRSPLEAVELQEQHLPDVPLHVIESLLAIVEDQFGEDPRLVRPNDNHCLINDDLDPSGYVDAIEKAFGVSFTDAELEAMNGTFGEIARYVTKHRKMV